MFKYVLQMTILRLALHILLHHAKYRVIINILDGLLEFAKVGGT